MLKISLDKETIPANCVTPVSLLLHVCIMIDNILDYFIDFFKISLLAFWHFKHDVIDTKGWYIVSKILIFKIRYSLLQSFT